jgi:hypothetical protein
LVILFILDFIIGKALEYAYFSQHKGRLYETTYSLQNVDSECLIFGCSRALQHYDPAVIEKIAGLTTYNLGSDGQSIIYHKLVLENILSRYKPKLIVLELFEVKDFAVGPWANQATERLSYLFPYLNRYPNLKEALWKRTKYEKIKLISQTYRYNSMILRIIEGNFGFFDYDERENGFRPNNFKLKEPLEKKSLPPGTIYDEEKVKYFYDFVDLCRNNDIPLYVVISPRYIICDNCSSFSHEICNKAKVELHDFSSESHFLSNIKYFGDLSHLNLEGSRLYSEFIGSKLRDFYNDFQRKKSSIASPKKHS